MNSVEQVCQQVQQINYISFFVSVKYEISGKVLVWVKFRVHAIPDAEETDLFCLFYFQQQILFCMNEHFILFTIFNEVQH